MEQSSSRQEKTAKVIDVLNQARGLELNAIMQYMNHHYNLADMDYGELAASVKLIAIDEMRHAEMFAERIKELGGEPVTAPLGTPERDKDAAFIFNADTQLEDGAIDAYNGFLIVCRESGDSTSVKLLESIIDDEQLHFNYFDNVSSHIDKLDGTYLARIAGTPSTTGLQTQGFVARQGTTPPPGGAGPLR